MQHQRALVILILAGVPSVLGAEVFNTNCTLPPEGVNYVSGPNVRSTLDILWSSLATIFLCTWTVQHLNIPDPKEASGLPAFWRRLKWMLVMIIAPEFMVGKAFGDWVAASASESCPIMKSKAKESKSKWTMTHAFYANMGGFLVHKRECAPFKGDVQNNPLSKPEDPQKVLSEECCREVSPIQIPTTERGPSASEADEDTDSKPSLVDRLKTRMLHTDQGGHLWPERRPWTGGEVIVNFPFAANSAQLCVLLSRGIISQLPAITKDEINDRSKGDIVVKLLALVQVAQLVVQLIARKVYDLHTTQLEIGVLSFAVCTGVTYVLWLKKPKDIRFPTDILTAQDLDNDAKETLMWLNQTGFFQDTLEDVGVVYSYPSRTIPNDRYNTEANLGRKKFKGWWRIDSEDIGFVIGGVVFGACHCIAWNLDFPTSVEQTLWRACSVVTAVLVPLYFLSWFLFVYFGVRSFLQRLVLSFFSILYILCRLFILAEVIRSLFYLPPDAFVSTWSVNFPYFG